MLLFTSGLAFVPVIPQSPRPRFRLVRHILAVLLMDTLCRSRPLSWRYLLMSQLLPQTMMSVRVGLYYLSLCCWHIARVEKFWWLHERIKGIHGLLGCLEAEDERWKAVKSLDNSEGSLRKCWAEVKIRLYRSPVKECTCSMWFLWFGSLVKVICWMKASSPSVWF